MSDETIYRAVRGQDFDECCTLGWSEQSVHPYIIVRGRDPEVVYQTACTLVGGDDVRLWPDHDDERDPELDDDELDDVEGHR